MTLHPERAISSISSTSMVTACARRRPGQLRALAWLAANPVAVARFERLMAEIERSGTFDVTTLTVALSDRRNRIPHDPLG
jgi:NAD-specific glutamate dehydrogenase